VECIFGIERFFASCFLLEVVLRLLEHGRWFFFNDNMKWNVLDFCLVAFAICDELMLMILSESGGSNMTFVRMLKMLKVAKMMRLTKALKAFKDLNILMHCIVGSLSALFWSFAMLGFILFICALFFMPGFTTLLSSDGALRTPGGPKKG